MATIQQLVDQLGPGWTVFGGSTPIEETAPTTYNDPTQPGVPQTINRGTGRYYVTVKDPDGHQRALFLKPGTVPTRGGLPDQVVVQTGVNDKIPNTSTDKNAPPTIDNPNIYKGDLSKLNVWQSGCPVADVPQQPNKPSPSGALDKLDASGNVIQPGDTTTPVVTIRDPGTGTTFNAAPAGDKPSDPSTWTPITDPNNPGKVAGLWDPVNNKMGATFAGDNTQKKSGTFTNVYDPNDPKRVIGLQDTGDKSVTAVARDPVVQKQIANTPNAIYVFNDDGTVANTIPINKDKALQSVAVGDQVYSFDPTTGAFTPGPKSQKPPVFVGGDASHEFNITYDPDTGRELTREKNPNWQATQATTPAVNTTARTILAPDPKDPSKLIWQDNKAFMPASDALQQLAAHLSGQVVDKNISIEDAKAVIDAANARMTNDINQQNADTQQGQVAQAGAGNIIQRTTTNAQTGGQLIQQRVQAATGLLNNVLGMANNRSPSGSFGGGMLQAPAGLGAQLVGGIQGWTADLAGGQSTLDSAARMVQQADPSSSMYDPNTQHAVGVLSQMLDKYQQITGQPHPGVAATNAANASVASNGLAAPVTGAAQSNPPGPSVQTAAPATARPVAPAVPAVPAMGAATGPNLTPNNPYANVSTAGMSNPGNPAAAGQPLVYSGTGMVPAPNFVAPQTVKPPPVTITVGGQ
jgi:hypothetical protein